MIRLIIDAEHPNGYKAEVPDEPMPPMPPSDEERISALESAMLAMMGGGL